MNRLTNVGKNGEIYITDNDETRHVGRKEAAYAKLKWYEDAEEQGLLLRLPCNVGDTVYHYRKLLDEILRYHVEQITIDYDTDSLKGYVTYNCICEDDSDHDIDFTDDDIGKTIFLTEEDAEQALIWADK